MIQVYKLKEIDAPWCGEGAKMSVVDISIHYVNQSNGGSVYWTPEANTYVMVERNHEPERAHWMFEGKPVDLVSIHGNGEIRWDVWLDSFNSGDDAAIAYFQKMGMVKMSPCEKCWHRYPFKAPDGNIDVCPKCLHNHVRPRR